MLFSCCRSAAWRHPRISDSSPCATLSTQVGVSPSNWRPSLSIVLAVLCFYSKTGFWPSYCQISTDLDKILHTPIVARNTHVGRLRPRLASGRLQAKPERLSFCNTCKTHLYRDDGSPRFRRQPVRVEVRTGATVKNCGICMVGNLAESNPKQHFFAF